jgi:hypothetical protein
LCKRVPTIRRPAAAPSVLLRERAQRSSAQQMGKLQLSGVMSQYSKILLSACGRICNKNVANNIIESKYMKGNKLKFNSPYRRK